MKKIFGIKIPDKKPIDREIVAMAAEECGYTRMIGLKLYEALTAYAVENGHDGITQAFLCKIPDDKIETIKGIKAAGHKIIDHLKAM